MPAPRPSPQRIRRAELCKCCTDHHTRAEASVLRVPLLIYAFAVLLPLPNKCACVSHAGQKGAPAPRRRHRRASRCDEAAARCRPSDRDRCGPGARRAEPMHADPTHAAGPAAARLTTHRAPLATPSRPIVLCVMHPVYTPRRVSRRASQDGKQPLHVAAAKGATSEVIKLLLQANTQAAASKDKACSRVHALTVYA